MAKNLALSIRKWHKKNLICENGGERKINPSANPVITTLQTIWTQNIGSDQDSNCLLDILKEILKDFFPKAYSKVKYLCTANKKACKIAKHLKNENNRL